jgi:outer membrane immunogenic protein
MRMSYKRFGVVAAAIFLLSHIALAAQAPDGTLRITRRSVSEGIGLTWGEGVLTFQNKEYPFTFHASGRLREVDVKATAAELSGQVFNLKNLEDFNGNYKNVEGETTGGGTRATIKNQRGVVLTIVSTVQGRKFNIAREGMDIEIKQPKG